MKMEKYIRTKKKEAKNYKMKQWTTDKANKNAADKLQKELHFIQNL